TRIGRGAEGGVGRAAAGQVQAQAFGAGQARKQRDLHFRVYRMDLVVALQDGRRVAAVLTAWDHVQQVGRRGAGNRAVLVAAGHAYDAGGQLEQVRGREIGGVGAVLLLLVAVGGDAAADEGGRIRRLVAGAGERIVLNASDRSGTVRVERQRQL